MLVQTNKEGMKDMVKHQHYHILKSKEYPKDITLLRHIYLKA
jgi:hypothetical protein